MIPVRVHEIALDRPEPEVARLQTLLDPEERRRAARFVREQHRTRFTVAHGELRRVLAETVGCAPAEVRFVRGPEGKPALAWPQGWMFNLSHSAGLALLAIGRGRDLGIDVEAVRDNLDALGLARRFFDPGESRWLRDASDDRLRRARFFQLWTHKEAVMKATGRGMHLPLRKIVFDPQPDGTLALCKLEGSADRAREWEVIPSTVSARFPGFMAALAVRAG